MANERVYLYPVWVRLWHAFNLLICLVLITTGVSMQYSNPGYPLIRFDIAVTLHNVFGVLLTLSYIVFVIGNWKTGNGKYYRAKIKGFLKRLTKQAIYYSIGIFKNTKKPYPITKKRKFNPLQKLSYIVIMYIFMPIIFITGWAWLYPETIIHNFLGFQKSFCYLGYRSFDSFSAGIEKRSCSLRKKSILYTPSRRGGYRRNSKISQLPFQKSYGSNYCIGKRNGIKGLYGRRGINRCSHLFRAYHHYFYSFDSPP